LFSAPGVAKVETMLDPFQPILDPVYAARLTGEITMEMSDRNLQRGKASFDLPQILTHLAKVGSNRAQMLQNEIVELIRHDGPLSFFASPRVKRRGFLT